jgi:hypothetical protein
MAKGPSNTGKIVMSMGRFDGGASTDYKNGIANSFYDDEALDHRSVPSQMSVNPGLTSITNSVITGLILAMVQDQNGIKWAVDLPGKVYRIDTSNNVTVVGTLPEQSGGSIVYNQKTDYLFFPGQQAISSYGPITGYGGISSTTPTWQYNSLAQSADIDTGVTALWDNATTSYSGSYRNNLTSVGANAGVTSKSQVGANPQAGATGSGVPAYTNVTIPTSINDSLASSYTPFSPSIEPFYSFAVYVVAKGTGNLIFTLHDGNNNVVSTVTILNAAVTAAAYNEFVFPAPGIRSYTGGIATGQESQYHFHMTSSVSSDTYTFRSIGSTLLAYDSMGNATNNSTPDMTGIDFILFAYRMAKTNNGLHPAMLYTGNNMFMAIGNGDYISTWDMTMIGAPTNSSYQRGAIMLDPGYENCSLTTNSAYLVMSAERRSTAGNAKEQDGMAYYWDGISQNWISRTEVPQGSPYALQTFGNITYFTVNGTLYAVSQPGVPDMKIRLISYQNGNYSGLPDSTIVYPNMSTVRNTSLLMGYPSTSQNPNVRYGVYEWGAVELTYPNSFGRSYMLSANATNPAVWTSANNLQMGCVYSFVDQLYVSWQYTDSSSVTHYGLDYMDNSSSSAANFSWASLIFDGGARYKQKELLRYKINLEPLPAGCTLTGWYSVNRGQPVTVGEDGTSYTITETGTTEVNIEPPHARFHEMQWGFYGTTPSGNMVPPVITSITWEISPLNEEVNVTPDDYLDDFISPTGTQPVGAIVLPVGTTEDVETT